MIPEQSEKTEDVADELLKRLEEFGIDCAGMPEPPSTTDAENSD